MASASPPGSPYRKQAGKLGWGMPSSGTRAAASPVTPEKAAGIFTFPTGMTPAQQGLGTGSELLPAPSPGWSCPCLLNWFCSVSAGTGPVTGMENTVQGHNPTAPRSNAEGKPTLLTTVGKRKINPKEVGNSTIPVQSDSNSSHGGDPDLVPPLIPLLSCPIPTLGPEAGQGEALRLSRLISYNCLSTFLANTSNITIITLLCFPSFSYGLEKKYLGKYFLSACCLAGEYAKRILSYCSWHGMGLGGMGRDSVWG